MRGREGEGERAVSRRMQYSKWIYLYTSSAKSARILKQGTLVILLSVPRKLCDRESKQNGVLSWGVVLEERNEGGRDANGKGRKT